MQTPERWRRCSTCKQDIPLRAIYWTCSISSCNRPRTGLVFCSVTCWDSHVPIMRHRDDAGAIETRAPAHAEPPQPAPPPTRKSEPPRTPSAPPHSAPKPSEPPVQRAENTYAKPEEIPREILVVVSKLKSYIKARSGFSTADDCAAVMSEHIRILCERAMDSARQHSRKTVLDRDVPRPPVRGGQ